MSGDGNSMPNFYVDEEWIDWYGRRDQVTADGSADNEKKDDPKGMDAKESKDKNKRTTKYVHVPHRDKAPHVVARRNARERRRVEAVNTAFVKLRKAIPFDNNRCKRISKVKTLQNAIRYIHNLQEVLNVTNGYDYNIPYYSFDSSREYDDHITYEDEF